MTDVPGAHLEEEPQQERGAPGSRDTGSPEPAGGPADRPVGTVDAEADTSIEPQGAGEGAPDLQSGAG
jgi:hypothetical protein